MKKKISSDLTLIFQIAAVLKLLTILMMFLFVLFLGDNISRLIMLSIVLIATILVRILGLFKLKKVYQTQNSLIIGTNHSKNIIPFSSIQKVQNTFLCNDFPHKITYIEENRLKKIYFLPKAKLLSDFFLPSNEIVGELKRKIKNHSEQP